jgi:ankyrin repeat protein
VRALLAKGAAVDERDDRDWTALHHAAVAGAVEAAGILLDRGADPDARGQFDLTPLHWAAAKGRAEVVGLLARRGARTDARSIYGMTPLHLAGNANVVTALVDAGAALDVLDDRGCTPLHVARHGQVAQALIDRGADLRIRTPQGRTAMEIAGVESLEGAGLTIHGPMLCRLRGLIGQATVTLMNVAERPLRALSLSARSPAGSIEVAPAASLTLHPGQLVDFTLTFTRAPDVREGEHPVFLAATHGNLALGEFDLRVDTTMGEIPQDRGMIRLAKGSLRPAPSRLHYLAYLAVPLLLGAATILLRRRRR